MLSDRLKHTLDSIDTLNAQDPRRTDSGDSQVPYELLYSQRMSDRLSKFAPQASDHLQIAVRAQHIGRWMKPRESYPLDRTGYLRWRTMLKSFHGELTGDLMRTAGYQDVDIARVQTILRKEGLGRDTEVQTLEDCACLVFLEFYFGEFAARQESDKMIHIVRKTWSKMSESAQQAALSLELSQETSTIVSAALGG